MAQAKRDQNHRTVELGVSSTDGVTTLPFRVDPVTNYLLIDIVTGALSATPMTMDKRDQNHVPTAYGISSVDGTTLVPIRTDDNGALLLDLA